jgi:hypothetical protein
MTDSAARRNYKKPGPLKQFFINLATDPALAFRIDAAEERQQFASRDNKEAVEALAERVKAFEEASAQLDAFQAQLDKKSAKLDAALKRVKEVDAGFQRVETAVAQIMMRDFSSATEIEVPLVNTGIEGRLQMLEEKLEALQTRLDIISVQRSAS